MDYPGAADEETFALRVPLDDTDEDEGGGDEAAASFAILEEDSVAALSDGDDEDPGWPELVIDVRAVRVGPGRIRIAEPVSIGGALFGIQFCIGDVLEIEPEEDETFRVVRVAERARTRNVMWYGVDRGLIERPEIAAILERLVSSSMCWEFSLGTLLFQYVLEEDDCDWAPEVDAEVAALDAALRRAGWRGTLDGGRIEPRRDAGSGPPPGTPGGRTPN